MEHLGAWLIKANGDRSDIAARAARREPVEQWCVQPSYRTALMAAGQRVVFWVSGRTSPGVWAFGELTGAPVRDPEGPDPKLRVPLRLHWLEEADRVPRPTLLADPRLDRLEVLRMPQGSNPSFVTPQELAAIEHHAGHPQPATTTSGPPAITAAEHPRRAW